MTPWVRPTWTTRQMTIVDLIEQATNRGLDAIEEIDHGDPDVAYMLTRQAVTSARLILDGFKQRWFVKLGIIQTEGPPYYAVND